MRLPEWLNSRVLNGLILLKGGLGLFMFLKFMIQVQGRALSKSDIRILRHFCRNLYKIHRDSGIKFLILYLKSCSTLLQQSVSGYGVVKDCALLGPRVSRTSGGLPRIIPAYQRKLIRKGDRLTVQR